MRRFYTLAIAGAIGFMPLVCGTSAVSAMVMGATAGELEKQTWGAGPVTKVYYRRWHHGYGLHHGYGYGLHHAYGYGLHHGYGWEGHSVPASDAFASCDFGLFSQSYPIGYSNCFGNPSFALDGVIPGERLKCLASGQWDHRGACYVRASHF